MKVNMKIPSMIFARKKIILLYTLGPLLILLGFLIYIINPLKLIVDSQLSFRPGSLLYKLWKKPPVEILLSLYMYNYTNVDRFVRGLDGKLKIEEIGPYVYQEILEYKNVTFNNNDTVTFVPVRTVKQRSDLSVSDSKIDQIIAPNIPYMGATAIVSETSIITSIALKTLTSTLGSKPMLKMPVHDYLWGYDDPLVRLASKVIPFFIDFDRFGILERMFTEGKNIVNMHIPTRTSNTSRNIQQFSGRDFSINTWNFEKTINYWTSFGQKKITDCNRVYGTFDGTLFPPHISKGDHFRLFRKAFCRTLPIVYDHETTFNGIDVYEFKLHQNSFDSSITQQNSSCFCSRRSCMPKGLGNITPCYYHMPLAITLPHFYNGDPRILDSFEGLKPSKEKHESIIYIEPKLGVPMHLKVRFQMNLVLKDLVANAQLQRFHNKVVPIFWVEMALDDIPSFLKLLYLCLFQLGPIIQYGSIILFICGGLFVIAYVFITQDPKTIYSPIKKMSLIQNVYHYHRGDEARTSLIPPSTKEYELENLTELELAPAIIDEETEEFDT